MTRLIAVAVAVAVAAVVAWVAQRRKPDVPTQPDSYEAPSQLDRADFESPDAPWLVAVFSSSTCSACDDVWTRTRVLASDVVAVTEVEVTQRADLHQRYRIEGVPTTVVADAEGVVRRSWIGPVSSTHLWAALAELRDPGSVPPGCGAQAEGGSSTSSPAT